MQGQIRTSEQFSNVQKKYLLRENKELKMQVSQLKEINQMHKNAIMVLSQQQLPNNAILPTLIDLIRTRPATRRDVALLKKVSELQSEVMVMEKIADQATDSEKQTYKLLVEEFRLLKDDNMRKDDSLNKFYQKIGEVDYLSGLVTKYVQVIAPTQLAMSFQKQKEQLLDALNLLKEQVKKLTEEKQKLVKINVHLKEELDRRKDQMRNMTMYINNNSLMENQNQMILDQLENERPLNRSINNGMGNISNGNISINQGNHQSYSMMNISLAGGNNNSGINSTLNFIRLQSELIKEEGGEDDSQFQDMEVIMDCPQLYNLFPDRVQRINSNRQRKRVPYLNMLKVRELMTKRENKLKKEMDEANGNVNPTTKIIRLQGELDITRKQLTSLMLKHRTIAEENKLISGSIQQLEARNQTLLEANNRLVNIHNTLQQEKDNARLTISRIQTIIGRKLMNCKISQQEMTQVLRATTRRNTVNQLLENVLITQPKPITRSISM